MHLILCILSLHVLFLLGKPAKLFETTHPDWAPSLHLGNENYNSCKSSSTVAATERYERSVKRKVLADAQSPANVQLKKKIIDKDTDGNTTNGKFLKSSLYIIQVATYPLGGDSYL